MSSRSSRAQILRRRRPHRQPVRAIDRPVTVGLVVEAFTARRAPLSAAQDTRLAR